MSFSQLGTIFQVLTGAKNVRLFCRRQNYFMRFTGIIEMSVVWLFDESARDVSNLWHSLAGNFAVRVFASQESFSLLARTNRGQDPNVIIFAFQKILQKDIDTFYFKSKTLFPKANLVALSNDRNLNKLSSFDKVFSLSQDPLNIVKYVQKIVFEDKKKPLLSVDLENLELLLESGEVISLSLKEARILNLLMSSHGTEFSRKNIMEKIWKGTKVSPRTIDAHVSRLRKKLLHSPLQLESSYGGGYTISK
jgi:DNA-binding CsgD family transcriptional regulator